MKTIDEIMLLVDNLSDAVRDAQGSAQARAAVVAALTEAHAKADQLLNAKCAEIERLKALLDAPKVEPLYKDRIGSCSEMLRKLGKAYPRTCATCGLGKCTIKETP